MDSKKRACLFFVVIMQLLLATQTNAQVRGATRFFNQQPILGQRVQYLIQGRSTPIQLNALNGYAVPQMQTVVSPIQTNAPNGYAVSQTQTVGSPIQPNAPNGYAVSQTQTVGSPIQPNAPNGYAVMQTQSMTSPIQPNAPNGYAVPVQAPTVDPTAMCDAKWQAALRREIMNPDDWQCGKKLNATGSFVPCIITGPTASSSSKNISTCGWKLPPFCDNTVVDLMSSLKRVSAPVVPYPVAAGYTTVPGVGRYKVHTEVVTWDQARAICQSEGMGVDLAVPTKLVEYQAILDLVNQALPAQTKGLFVGITDVAVEGTFVSVTGQPICLMGDVLFLPGEPNNSGNEDCLEIGFMKGLVLNDISCTSPLPFVCEQVMLDLTGPC